MNRYIYALQQLITQRKSLTEYMRDPALQSKTIFDIRPHDLYAQGVRVLIVDFDGVLAAHAEHQPTALAAQWLNTCVQCFGVDRVFILSNNPLRERQEYFSAVKQPRLFIVKAKKPFPHGILAIKDYTGCSLQEILIIDDRLATGVLAAIIAGVKAILIMQPMTNFKTNPGRELFFMILRKIERFIYS